MKYLKSIVSVAAVAFALSTLAFTPAAAHAQNIPVPPNVCTDTTWATLANYLETAVSTDLNWGGYLKAATSSEDRHVIYHMATMGLINDQAITVISSCGIPVPEFMWSHDPTPNMISPRNLFVNYIEFDATQAQKDLAPFLSDPPPTDAQANLSDVATQLNDMDISMSLYQEQPYQLIYPQ